MPNTYLPGDTRQRVQDLIKNRKITQAELAEKVGLSNSALSRYLQGRTTNLGDGFIIRIVKYFNVSTDFLIHIDLHTDMVLYSESLDKRHTVSTLFHVSSKNSMAVLLLIKHSQVSETFYRSSAHS
ncbi:helix-turn-helix domain-containing protein [Clostridium vitabionis]|uniref:helix-turn-helix domain-containing protein n=1 Tax=Clostridium vitabionis TaxID=2784388 RepID=UPI00188C6C13|nr:helix-turn-helix transcriptional regulator [Clostridium vitabionis]